MHELMLVRFKRPKDAGNCNGSSFLCTPMQSQRRNEEEKDNHYPNVREKIQGECSQFLFIHFKLFHEPWRVGVPRSQSGNPIEHSEKDANRKGAKEKVSKEDDFFAFHD